MERPREVLDEDVTFDGQLHASLFIGITMARAPTAGPYHGGR
jgi:hypothetical protein